MNYKARLIVLSILLVSFSCKQKSTSLYENAIIIHQNDFGDFIKLKGEEVTFDEMIFRPYKMMIKDSILIIYNVSTEYAYQLFNLKNKKYIGESMLIGNGPNELLYPTFIQSNDNDVWLFDQAKATAYAYDMSTFIQKNKRSLEPLKTIHIKDKSEQLSVIKGHIFSFKLNQNLNNNRFNIFDMDGKPLHSVGSFPCDCKGMTFEEINFGFTSEYSTNFKDRIFVSYRLTDLIEIYDINGNLIKRIVGPEQFIPSVIGVKKGFVSYANGIGKAREAYFYPANGGEEVFVTYSGELFSENVFYKNQIRVFDWNGKPLRKYLLDIPIYGTIVDSKNRFIYGFNDEPECHLMRFRY